MLDPKTYEVTGEDKEGKCQELIDNLRKSNFESLEELEERYGMMTYSENDSEIFKGLIKDGKYSNAASLINHQFNRMLEYI